MSTEQAGFMSTEQAGLQPEHSIIKAAAHCELEASVVAANDMVDEAIRLRLQRRHVPVTVCVLLELHRIHGSE
jgi:hypothetical protein